jgi:hypothetical protein
MAMQPTLWSVNALATEFGLDRRTVAKRLRDVPPAGERGGHPVWRLADVMPTLSKHRTDPRRENPAGTQYPPGFEWLADVPPHAAFAGLALMLMAYRLPSVVACLAVASGASCRVAYALVEAMHLAALKLAAEVALDCRLPPWADEDDPEIVEPDCFEAVDWPRLAEAAGEPLDRDTWAAWARERFA